MVVLAGLKCLLEHVIMRQDKNGAKSVGTENIVDLHGPPKFARGVLIYRYKPAYLASRP